MLLFLLARFVIAFFVFLSYLAFFRENRQLFKRFHKMMAVLTINRVSASVFTVKNFLKEAVTEASSFKK